MSSIFGGGSSTPADSSSKGNFDFPVFPCRGEKRSSSIITLIIFTWRRRSQCTQGGGHVLRSQRACPRERPGTHQRS